MRRDLKLKKLLLIMVIGALVLGAWLFLSPRMAARDLREAAVAGDVEELQERVDFPLVQEQLKADLKANLLRSMDTSESSGLGGAFAAGLGGMMIDGVVNQVVSPSGIAALVRYGSIDTSGSARPKSPDLITDMHHESLNTFVITARNRHSPPRDTVRFVMRRRGLSWQLVRVVVPELRP